MLPVYATGRGSTRKGRRAEIGANSKFCNYNFSSLTIASRPLTGPGGYTQLGPGNGPNSYQLKVLLKPIFHKFTRFLGIRGTRHKRKLAPAKQSILSGVKYLVNCNHQATSLSGSKNAFSSNYPGYAVA